MNSRTDLLAHQRAAVQKMMLTRIGALFMEMGTGKSRTAIELALRRQERMDHVVWMCPVSLKETIAYEIAKHTDATPHDIHVFDGKTSEADCPQCRWYVVGIESMSASARVIFAVNRIVTARSMVIVDESSYIKGHRAQRTARITRIAERARYRLILTGTPLSQGVVDLFAQMRFLSPKILGYQSFYSFARNHLEYHPRYKGLIVAAHNVAYLAAKVNPYVYQVQKSECLDLPEKIYLRRCCFMSDEQSEAYRQAKRELLAECEADDWGNIAIYRLFTALQQIVSGFWNRRGEAGEVQNLVFPHDRLATLLSTVREIPLNEKIIIWAKYHYDLDGIEQALVAEHGDRCVARFDGRLSEAQRNAHLDCFRDTARFFIATPSCGGHGLTLNEAHHVIYYNNGFKYSERLQTEDRCHRIGQTHSVVYIDIVCMRSIDERIAAAIERKADVVDRFRRHVEAVKHSRSRLVKLTEDL